ncbi:MAG: hypothetical protein V4463_04440 [Pseudomonadota bacterium]
MKAHALPFLLAVCCGAACGLDAAAEQTAVVIRGLRNPEGMAYASFIAAQQAYAEHRQHAPDAPLLFQMKTHTGNVEGLHLSINGDHTTIPVAYDEAGRFVLPYSEAALKDDAVLMADKRLGEIYWLPVIRTPGLQPGTQRLGDLRLYCHVKWALEKGDASLATKMMATLMGGCSSSAFESLALPQPGMLVRLSTANKQETFAATGNNGLYVAHRTRWQPPFGDQGWPDETVVEFLAPEDGFVLDPECARTRDKEASEGYQHSYGVFGRDSCIWRPN